MTSPEIGSAVRSEPPNSCGNEEEAFSQQEPRFFSFPTCKVAGLQGAATRSFVSSHGSSQRRRSCWVGGTAALVTGTQRQIVFPSSEQDHTSYFKGNDELDT